MRNVILNIATEWIRTDRKLTVIQNLNKNVNELHKKPWVLLLVVLALAKQLTTLAKCKQTLDVNILFLLIKVIHFNSVPSITSQKSC